LTGAPVERIPHKDIKDKEVFWKQLVDADLKTYVMCSVVHSSFSGLQSKDVTN